MSERVKPLEPEKILTRVCPDATSRTAVILLGHSNLPPAEKGRERIGRYQQLEAYEMKRMRVQTQGSC